MWEGLIIPWVPDPSIFLVGTSTAIQPSESLKTRYKIWIGFRFVTLHAVEHRGVFADRFRTCLRTVGSDEARMVGQVFFNVIGVKCFVLRVRPESVCTERAWYGRCLTETTVNNEYAELRGPLSF